MRGNKPKPTAIKLIEGNKSNHPMNKNEPKPTTGCPKPKWLPLPASVVWDTYAPELTKLGILTVLDGETFAAFCLLAGRMRSDPARFPINYYTQLRLMAQDFGMVPVGRPRLQVSPAEAKPGAADFFVPASKLVHG